LRHTWPGRLTLIGLLLVVVGQLVNIALELGKEWSLFDIGPDGVAVAKAAVAALTLVGAAVAAWQGLLKS
jgi:hypothetical protein